MYLLFQTLVGTWPLRPQNDKPGDEYVDRIAAYMQKALREAKRRTSWVSPSALYESTVTAFVRTLLADDGGAAVRTDMAQFAGRIATAGYINGLTQVLLKATLPGVPDYYQGGEHWDFSLVDPDNRRAVDFQRRRRMLDDLQQQYAKAPGKLTAALGRVLGDDRVKQFITWRALATRGAHAELLSQGEYMPLAVSGKQAPHVFAMARELDGVWIAVVVPRQIQCLLDDRGRIDWRDTAVELPAEAARWHNEFTGGRADSTGRVADLLQPLPVALLTSQSP
jgi:(1->4)-alpha-D-glucan 1-alpha-D-glucosylmutase